MDLNSHSLGFREGKSHFWRQGSVILQKLSAIPHSLICWKVTSQESKVTSQKADNKNWSYLLVTPPLSSNWASLQAALGVSVFQYLPKGVGLAAKGKQEMAWKLIKLAESSFLLLTKYCRAHSCPQGTETGNLATERDSIFLSCRADL